VTAKIFPEESQNVAVSRAQKVSESDKRVIPR